MQSSFIQALVARGPHPSLGAHAETYGRVIGSWLGRAHNHMLGRPLPAVPLEVHFAWALDGRAVQDVWITPPRAERGGTQSPSLDWYGTTLRVFDPQTESWRTTWTDPVTQLRIDLVGRRQGDDIVQLGTRGGRPIRWTFSSIGADSFRWQGHILSVDGQTWQLEVDVELERSGS